MNITTNKICNIYFKKNHIFLVSLLNHYLTTLEDHIMSSKWLLGCCWGIWLFFKLWFKSVLNVPFNGLYELRPSSLHFP